MKTNTFLTLCFFLSCNSIFGAPDWSSEATLPGGEKCFDSHGHHICLKDGDRRNILELDKVTLQKFIYEGSKHALNYPVEITPLKLPQQAMQKFFNSDTNSPLRRFIFKIAQGASPFKSFDDLFNWLGLHKYPQTTHEYGPNVIANMGSLEKFPMGVASFDEDAQGAITFGCAACHSNNLFGVKILGMTNRFPRANEFFIMGKKLLKNSNTALFKLLIGPNDEDVQHYKNAKQAINYVQLKKPQTLGLDTSLAQVGLSLATRNHDAYATKPRRPLAHNNPLKHQPADSKPAVWWNLKYKTKWLSDASIESGNPIFTNFLWNEIGRGVDLKELENWLKKNKHKVEQLTSYVFYNQAPAYNDFFPGEIEIQSAKRGEKLYLNNCKSCHGIYEKGWSDVNQLTYEEQIKTTKVWYHKQTRIVDVETDPYRYQGMNYFAENLNQLQISKNMGTLVTPKKGYVPPPLVGIWARWPYMHNNSIPTLYDVLTTANKRPKTYIATPSEDKELDFDKQRNGYPKPEYIKTPYREDKKYFFDTRIKGLSNQGHTKMLLNEFGQDKFSHQDKLDLISFLKTL